MGLGRKSSQFLGFKGVIAKVFHNQRLKLSKALKMALGQLRGPSWKTGTLLAAPIQSIFSHLVGVEVCDGNHGSDVMNGLKAYKPNQGLDRAPSCEGMLARASRLRRNPNNNPFRIAVGLIRGKRWLPKKGAPLIADRSPKEPERSPQNISSSTLSSLRTIGASRPNPRLWGSLTQSSKRLSKGSREKV
jgi:hypothetical protein